jgi:NAD(P)-dependent dehydrogenase (short-subunit alcohol dehydrogenase family)
MTSLDGRVAIVTGAAGGIGGAVAKAFAGAGAAVLALDRDPDRVEAGEGVIARGCDLIEPAQVADAVRAAVARFGRVDLVFNGAGISGRRLGDGPVHRCTEEGWSAVLEANLTSVFHVCKHAVPALIAVGGGSIVNLGSVLGLVGGDEDFATHAYAASKGGVVALTRAIAVTYAHQGIRCNVICPGLVATAMSRRAQEDPRIRARLPELQPLTGDFAAPEDVAGAALWLAGPESRFVTGVVLPVDGGWTAR